MTASCFIPLAELKHLPTYAEDQAYWSKLWQRHGCTDPRKNYAVSFFDGRVTMSNRASDKVPVRKISKSNQA